MYFRCRDLHDNGCSYQGSSWICPKCNKRCKILYDEFKEEIMFEELYDMFLQYDNEIKKSYYTGTPDFLRILELIGMVKVLTLNKQEYIRKVPHDIWMEVGWKLLLKNKPSGKI